MEIFLGIVLPVILMVTGIFYSYRIHKRYFLNWFHEANLRGFLGYIIPTLLKSIIAMTLIIIIHNSVHDDHYYQLTLFIIVFLVFSIIQSPYSFGGFHQRLRNLLSQYGEVFQSKSRQADRFIERFKKVSITQSLLIPKLLIISTFVFVFIPNIGLFITSNILYFLLFVVMIVFSLLINNMIYFGFVSLLVFQYDPIPMTIEDANLVVLVVSFIIILVGLSLENRLESKMFTLVRVLPVKKFNFRLGYDTILNKRGYIILQNQVNHYYYIYFRRNGLVAVYYSDFNRSTSRYILAEMTKQAKYLMISHDESI